MTELGILLSFTCKFCPCFREGRYDMLNSAEDAAGPTATCQITTYEPEPQLELPFENDAV